MSKKEHNSTSSAISLPLMAVLALALTIRIIHILIIKDSPLVKMPIIDSLFYHEWAKMISDGSFKGDSVYFMSPLYSYFIALFYKIISPNPLVILFVQAILGTLSVWLIYLITRNYLDEKTALIASIISALYAPFIFFDGVILTSTLILFLSLLIIFFLLKCKSESSIGMHAMIGGLIALSALARPLVLIFLPFLLVYFLIQNRITYMKRWGTVVLGVALVLFPVAMRNLIVGGEFSLTTSSAGMNFYVGNNADATGLYWEAPFLSSWEPWNENEEYRLVASENMGKVLSTKQAGTYWQRQAMSWMINNPSEYLSLLGRKFLYFFNSTEFANNVSIYFGREMSGLLKFNPIGFWLVAPLGLGGLVMIWRRNGFKKVAIPIFWISAYVSGCLLFFVSSEYRLPIVPLLIIGAAYWLTTFMSEIRLKKSETVLKIIILALLFTPLVNLRTSFIDKGRNARMDFFNIGNTLLAQNNHVEAIKYLNRSIEIDPYFVEGLHRLAEAYYRNGQIDMTRELGRRVGMEDPETMVKIAQTGALQDGFNMLNSGNFDMALREFDLAGMTREEAVAETTRAFLLNRAKQLYESGDLPRTLQMFQEIYALGLEVEPAIPFNIAFLHWQLSNVDSSEYYTKATLEIDSLNAHAIYLLARIYNATNRQDQAEKLMISINPDRESHKVLLKEVRANMDSLIIRRQWEDVLTEYSRYGKFFYDIDLEDKLRIGIAQIEIGNLDQGYSLLIEAERGGVSDAKLHLYKGIALVKLDRTSEAIASIQNAIMIEPNYINARVELAQIYLSNGNARNALRELEAVSHLEIYDTQLFNQYTELLRQAQHGL